MGGREVRSEAGKVSSLTRGATVLLSLPLRVGADRQNRYTDQPSNSAEDNP